MKSFFVSILFTGMTILAVAQDPSYPAAPAQPQNIVAAEYYVDNDPGIGSATAVAVSPGVTIANINPAINITGLSNGMHRLVLRTKNTEGSWSVANYREFLYDFNPPYQPVATTPGNIVAAEYFIDTDPGVGNAAAISVSPGTDLSSVPVAVATAGLSNGSHRLFIRSKSNTGIWSLVFVREFLIDFNFAYPAIAAAPQNIVSAEYFLNTDPGCGSATAIPITPGTELNNVPAVINTSGLQNGTNRLGFRTKNAAGFWSVTQTREFVYNIDPPYATAPAAPQDLVAAEYFINTDPGPGNGTNISFAAGTDVNNIAVGITTASLAPATTNKLFLRTKNAEGFWSVTNAKEFVVTISNDPAYPLAPAA
ncbi:MAG: hypothetical protein EOP51_24395, partial [Sphingobacteriales bacterium]